MKQVFKKLSRGTTAPANRTAAATDSVSDAPSSEIEELGDIKDAEEAIQESSTSFEPSVPQLPPDTPSPPPSVIASHPVTPIRDDSLPTPRVLVPARPSNGGEFSTHLRKMTNNLIEIVDQMSQAASSKENSVVVGKRPTMGRGDSVATVADLESQEKAALSAEPEVVPVHHVRRLTNTLVDILRHVATGQQQQQQDGDIAGGSQNENTGLLADTASDYSYNDDKLSLYSSKTGTTTSQDTVDSKMSAQTALLKAAFLPQQEYKGDEVRPFYMDNKRDWLPRNPSDTQLSKSSDETDSCPIPAVHKKTKRINIIGLTVFLYFIAAFITYIVIRATQTLGLGSMWWYGAIVLAVEILGGLAMLPYGLCLTARVETDDTTKSGADKNSAFSNADAKPTILDYHIRVVIPCYKEPLDVIAKTVVAALYAPVPPNCQRTVYLLDDGRDAEKRKFIRSLGLHNAVYISGRKRAKGEMNGKSANINNSMRLIYPEDHEIPLTEVICVFDADQVPNADFFTKMVPKMDGGQDVGMVLSPQTFYNLNPDGDIFNHANVHFWDYTQVGYDALGLISCTGTNFLLRAKAFKQAGWFPEWTLTEDFALGIELKKHKWQCRYVDEYLAVGEAPDEVRNCFQQRSRWAKGHFQVFFSNHNPAVGPGSKNLSLLMRWMYGSVVLSYFSAFLGTPLLMLVPIITVWLGSFPIVINFWAALSITIYYIGTMALIYYTRHLAHLKSMWFAGISNSVLWFAFLKAMWRSTVGRWLSGTIVFKVTAKGLQRLNRLPLQDVWMSTIFFIFSLTSLIVGLVHFFQGGVLDTPLAISIIFMAYNLIPQYLLLQYAIYRPKWFYNAVCKIMMFLGTALMILGLVLIWTLYPSSYNYKSTLSSSVSFYSTQQIGTLPANHSIKWRSSAFSLESATSVYLAVNPNLTFTNGGFGSDPFFGGSFDPFGGSSDPFGGNFGSGGGGFSSYSSDPFAGLGGSVSSDPFARGRRRLLQATTADPFADLGAGSADPFATTPTTPSPKAPTSKAPESNTSPADPFSADGATSDPFAIDGSDPFASSTTPGSDPFATPPSNSGLSKRPSAGFGGGNSNDPFSDGDLALDGGFDEQQPLELATEDAWDLEGGWMSGMEAGNMKVTSPIAFTTAVLSWGYLSFPDGFKASKSTDAILDSVRWGADYLMKVHRYDPARNTSLLVTRVGDVDTELILWYRPEDGGARDAYAVDMATEGADLGGSVAAGLAAAASVFQSRDVDYSKTLLNKAEEVYEFAKMIKGRFSEADFNVSLIYNSTSAYDDLAWAAGWLYKATRNNDYLEDVYTFYDKHLRAEGKDVDWKFAFDWDNTFWALNFLLAQETGMGTFTKQSELFLRNWMCANNAANYTQKGRAFNPMSAPLGSTANAAMLALMYADVIESKDAAASNSYRCWALSQLRYMLGDAGRSLVVGMGHNPPKRTQDRAAACPKSPKVCNRVTGFLSPDPDTNVLKGALVYGTALSDNYLDFRTSDSARVGIENNAGFVGALAGAVLLPDGMWEVCLQQFGIIRRSPVCGSYVVV